MSKSGHTVFFLMVIGVLHKLVAANTEVLSIQVTPSPKQAVGADVQITLIIRFKSMTSVSLTLDEKFIGQIQSQSPVACSENIECSTPGLYPLLIVSTTILKNLTSSNHLFQVLDDAENEIGNVTLLPSFCANLTQPGIEQNVPQNLGFLSIHKFTCSPGYISAENTATCLEDGTWNGVLHCVKENCNQSRIPVDGSLNNTLFGITPVGESIGVPCSNGYSGSITAKCVGPDQWDTFGVKCLAIDTWVGIGIGCLFFICLVIAAIYCWRKRYTKSKDKDNTQ